MEQALVTSYNGQKMVFGLTLAVDNAQEQQ